MKRQKLSFTICKAVAAVAAGILTIALSAHLTQATEPTAEASEPVINPEYLQEYNQVQKLEGYTITLTHGAYSDKTRTGLCVFEIEKDEGKMKTPMLYDDNVIDNGLIGDNDKHFTINLCSTGSIVNRGFMKDNKLIVYTNFEARPLETKAVDEYNKHQVILIAGDGKGDKAENELFVKSMNGAYGFKLEDNVSGKEYEVDDTTTLSLSYFGFFIESDHKWKNLKVEVETKNMKETLIDDEKLYGNYSESSHIDGGCQKYDYHYTFDDINYDIDKIKAIYVNGKKISD